MEPDAQAATEWWLQMLTVRGFNPNFLDAFVGGYRAGVSLNAELTAMLIEADSLLSLTLYRGEGRDNPTWNHEAQDLVRRIRIAAQGRTDGT